MPARRGSGSRQGDVMPDLASVFSELKALMSPYAARLDVKTDSDTELYLDTRHRQKNGRALFFGAVQVKKGFVSFHLMPVYVQPALLEGISPALAGYIRDWGWSGGWREFTAAAISLAVKGLVLFDDQGQHPLPRADKLTQARLLIRHLATLLD